VGATAGLSPGLRPRLSKLVYTSETVLAQYAITHTREIEYIIVTKGSGTMVTGGTLIPPTIDSDIYPNPDPNTTIHSLSGVNGGLARKIGVGDVIINPPGTPHWLSEINDTIEYVEIRVSTFTARAISSCGSGVDPASALHAIVSPARNPLYIAATELTSKRHSNGWRDCK
jgi:hypothetical protein